MKHKLLPTLIGAVLAGGMSAAQADITVFGYIDTALVSHDADRGFLNTGKMPSGWDDVTGNKNIAGADSNDNIDDVNFVCTTCSIGFKGAEDLGNGLSAIFKLDFQYDIFNRNSGSSKSTNALFDRDQWLGLKGNFGQVRWGTISTGYKSHGAMIDPLYRTAAQGRANGMQSFLHNNAGEDGEGRAEHTVRWDSPNWNGFKATAHYTLDSNETDGRTVGLLNPSGQEDDDGFGFGGQYTNGGILVFADYISNGSDDVTNPNGDLTAWKVGGKYKVNNFALMGQFEAIDDNISIAGESGKQEMDLWHLGGSYTMGNNMYYAGYGAMTVNNLFNNTGSSVKDDIDQTAFTLAGVHKMSKRTSVYVAYNRVEQDYDKAVNDGYGLLVTGTVNDPEKDTFALGMNHKF